MELAEIFKEEAASEVEEPQSKMRHSDPSLYENVTISLDGAECLITLNELKAATAAIFTLQSVFSNMIRRCDRLEDLAKKLKELGIEL